MTQARLGSALLLVVAATASDSGLLSPAAIDCVVNASSGSFVVTVNGARYFSSGPTFFRANGTQRSTADGTLSVASVSSPSPGSDSLGVYSRVDVVWRASGAAGEAFRTAALVYADAGAVVFEQSWPGGAVNTSAPGGDPDSTISSWPSFALEGAGPDAAVCFGGRFLEGSKAVPWSDASRGGLPSTGQHGGPLVAFDDGLTTSVAVLSLTQHTVSISAVVGGSLAYGMIGSVTSVPAGFASRLLVAATAGGPTAGMLRAGRLALQFHNTTRAPDMTTKTLGYASTQNKNPNPPSNPPTRPAHLY